jgi:TetR/AcrR family transcriptional repressor of nem operon
MALMARHKAFDEAAVLDRAMEYFWLHGYEKTSIQDLVKNLGVKVQSLYNTFGSKRDLYRAALKHYVRKSDAIAILEQTPSGKEAIVKVFRDALDSIARSDCRKGCFIANTAVELAPHDPEIAAWIEQERLRAEKAYYNALVRAREQGDLPERHHNLVALARFLHNAHGGLMVTAKTVRDMAVLEDIVQVTLSIFD